MLKRIMIFLIIICSLVILSSCAENVKVTTPPVSMGTEDSKSAVLDTMYSISEAFLNTHYSVNADDVQEYDLLEGSLSNPDLNDYSKKHIGKQIEELINQKYQAQPLTKKGLELIKTNATPETLWKAALSINSDGIKITSVKTSLKNTGVDDNTNDINYKVSLLINGTSYEISGTLVLVLVDNKWMIDNIQDSEWSPALSY